MIFEMIRSIKKCKSITREEQNWLIKNGLLEPIVNLPKQILKLPFLVIGKIFYLLVLFFEWISNVMDLAQEIFDSIITKIDVKIPTKYLTKGQIRDIAFRELKENNFYKK